MTDYIECVDCDFVLLSGCSEDPEPKGRQDSCPNCGCTDFRFTDE